MIFGGNIKQRSVSGADLKANLNRLFNDHVYWTRMFIVSSLGELHDGKEVANRLLKNQTDIALYLGMFYPNAVQAINNLFTQHVVIASEMIDALNRKQDVSNIRKKWYANADQLSSTLSQVNHNLNLRTYLYKNLQLTENSINLRLSKNYVQEILQFDEIVKQANDMSDFISKAIIFQNPNYFK